MKFLCRSEILLVLLMSCRPAQRGHSTSSPTVTKVVVHDIAFETRNHYISREYVHDIKNAADRRRALQATRIVLERGWELGCFPFRSADEAVNFYSDDEIAVSLPAGLSIPKPGALRLRRATEVEVEKAAKQDCVARPFWEAQPDELFYTPGNTAERLYAVTCVSWFTDEGVPKRDYPAEARTYYVLFQERGLVEIRRTPVQYIHHPPHAEQVALRRAECERQQPSRSR